ncbi:hypothetical protein BDZ97DRAFT_1922381 [Flammula alnicola]|nr:hypothetical protein BDZ97DRAFT_1922381 [Flammula alnicola]
MASELNIDLNNTIGALQIGSLFGVFLFGIVSLQTYNYYNAYRDDGWVNKTLVATIWLLEIAHTLGINYEVYRVTIILYGKPWLLGRFQGIGAVTIFGGGITLIVQTFFALRLSRLLPRPYNHTGIICIIISSLRFIATIYLTVEGIVAVNMTVYREKCEWIVSATFIASAVVDITVAVSMMYFLARQRRQVKRISRLLDRLVMYTDQASLLGRVSLRKSPHDVDSRSISAIAVVLCFQLMPDNFIWLAVYTFVAKLYSNSFLSALNARKDLRADIINGDSITPEHFTMPDLRHQDSSRSSRDDTPSPFRPVIISMKTTTERMDDSPDFSDKSNPYHHTVSATETV